MRIVSGSRYCNWLLLAVSSRRLTVNMRTLECLGSYGDIGTNRLARFRVAVASCGCSTLDTLAIRLAGRGDICGIRLACDIRPGPWALSRRRLYRGAGVGGGDCRRSDPGAAPCVAGPDISRFFQSATERGSRGAARDVDVFPENRHYHV